MKNLNWLKDELAIEERDTPNLPYFFVKIRLLDTLKKIEGFINQRTNFLVQADPCDFQRLHDHINFGEAFVYADIDFIHSYMGKETRRSVERVWCSLLTDPDELSVAFDNPFERFRTDKGIVI